MTYPVALYLQDAHDIRQGIELAQYAEAKGFDAVWQADSRLVRDAVVPMAAFAANTERIKIGSGVLDIWTRNPPGWRRRSRRSTIWPRVGSSAASGRGGTRWPARWGSSQPAAEGDARGRRRPRGLLANETVTSTASSCTSTAWSSTTCTRSGARRTCRSTSAPPGMQMMELTGEIADGVVLNYLVSPSYNTGALEALAARRGAKSGRTIDDIDRPSSWCVPSTRQAGGARWSPPPRHAVPRPAAAHHEGVGSAPGAARRDRQGAHVARHPRRAGGGEQAIVPDEIVQMITAAGTPEEVRAKVDEYVAAGCTCPILYPLGDDVHLMIDTFAR
jgi:5,10-methylenetetrahydromethanopterin reductase